MDLVTVRELYKNPEKFLDKEIKMCIRDSTISAAECQQSAPVDSLKMLL